MTVESRLTDVEETLRLLRDADRLQGRRVSAAAPSDLNFMGWNATTKKWEPKAGVLNADLSQVDVVSSTTETTLYSFTIPADTLGATGGLLLTLSGDILVNTAGTFVIKVKLGATTVFTSSAQDMADSATRRNWSMQIAFTNSATNAQKWRMHYRIMPTGTGLRIGSTDFRPGLGIAESTEDTTLDRTIDVTLQWDTNSASLSFRKEIAVLERVGLSAGTGASSGDHGDLTGVTTSQHHTKYTDAEAILAVEGEATLDLAGLVKLTLNDTTIKEDAEYIRAEAASGRMAFDLRNSLLINLDANSNDTTAALKIRHNASTTDMIRLNEDGSIDTDVINEITPAAGVTIDSLLIKDGKHAYADHTSKPFHYSITIEDPTSSEDITIAFTNEAITITEIRAVLVGSATPSVTWTIRHGTDRNATGAEAVTSGTTTTSTTTGSDVTSFNDATIVADSFIWLETTAKSGTVTEIALTIIGTVD